MSCIEAWLKSCKEAEVGWAAIRVSPAPNPDGGYPESFMGGIGPVL